ncbi:MAG TPA: GNAT family protein [Rhizomicrobium sp.]|jgi:RimJ/RimL family protein N-acetyltransferase|nr:GNAT family protein [Rhizomicrobium sp.]
MEAVAPLGGRTLTGKHVALEPLEQRHHAELIRAGADVEIWRYIPVNPGEGFAARLPWIESETARNTMLAFAVRRLSDNAIVGSTSYLAISQHDAKVEIGMTWYVAGAQGTPVNPEAKYLLLENAFGARYNRVEFKTDSKNLRSRGALRKLGAKEEGTLRAHMWMPQGYFRDSVYFSILASEWPDVKKQLEARLAAFQS